jgi:hypothetical protein
MKRTVSSLLLILLVSLSLVWPAAIKSRAQTTKTTAPQTQTALPGDRAWPRGYSLPSEAQIVIFQPQVATWEEQKHLVARRRFRISRKTNRNLPWAPSSWKLTRR